MKLCYNPPSKFSPAPYGELIKVMGETKDDIVSYTYYIQISEDPDKPDWITVGDFLTTVLENNLQVKVWLMDKLIVYKNIVKERE
jgi:hypothetical protein